MKSDYKNLLVVIGTFIFKSEALNVSSWETAWMRKEQWHLDLRAFHLTATVHSFFFFTIGFGQKCISQYLQFTF